MHNCNWRTNTTSYKARGRVDEFQLVSFPYPYLQFSIADWSRWWPNLGKIFILNSEGKLEMFLCCHLISNWFKFCVKIFRNASKNLLTCTLLAFRKILSYIPDQSDLRQQSINISNICSSPVVLHWQPRAAPSSSWPGSSSMCQPLNDLIALLN